MKSLSPVYVYLLLLTIVLMVACNSNTPSELKKKELSKKEITQADSAILHFWDKVNMQDTISIKDPNQGEQQLADFLGLLAKTTDSATRDQAVAHMLDKAKANKTSFDHFIRYYR